MLILSYQNDVESAKVVAWIRKLHLRLIEPYKFK